VNHSLLWSFTKVYSQPTVIDSPAVYASNTSRMRRLLSQNEDYEMSFRLYSSRNKLLAGWLALAVPLAAMAAPPPDGKTDGHGAACDREMRGPPGGPMGGPPLGMFAGDRPPPYLMELNLTEDQQDKVFAIMHASAPAIRDQFKAVRKAREALHDLGHAVQFDSGNAGSLAQALGKAESQLALLHARNDHDIFAVLTDEQRKELADHEHEQGPAPP
jgi:periplasmic protein CpxP/Spy